MWFRRKTAYNKETGQSYNVISGTSEFDTGLYPSSFFAYFDSIQAFNTYTLMFDELRGESEGVFTILTGENLENLKEKTIERVASNG